MPKDTSIKSVLIIGSGPIVIGQACEFDYSGVQACLALKEEKCRVILVNSNPASIMTDPGIADATYIEPITWEVVAKIIKKERPDALLPIVGGQTALNCTVELVQHKIIDKFNVQIIGSSYATIVNAENREKFKQVAIGAGLAVPNSICVHNMNDAEKAFNTLYCPLIMRASFSLGGYGSIVTDNRAEFIDFCEGIFARSCDANILVEEAVLGWKEYELEVMRDKKGNCIVICSIENINPMGVHTGDSITVAPAQTLTDKEYQKMRIAAFRIMEKIGMTTGGCNVQFAVNPYDGRMLIIEINPRVSRSSALASKATGFPIAKVATKLALGYTLDEIKNEVTGGLIPASFEPSIDYVVTKIPRFNFEKFPECDARLTTQMKSIGEVMAIGGNFQESLQKAICSLDNELTGLESVFDNKEKSLSVANFLEQELTIPSAQHLWLIADAFRTGFSLQKVATLTNFDPWFLNQIRELVEYENQLTTNGITYLNEVFLSRLKRQGFSDARLAKLCVVDEQQIRILRKKLNIYPVYKRIDSCAGEFPTSTAYLYSTYAQACEAHPTSKKKILIIGSGANRIGQGIEFDYCCVHATQALRELGYETIMVNCNPETVSTDYDISDRLYFEPLTLEHVLAIIDVERPQGALVQFGGQTPLHLASSLEKAGVKLIGTSADTIDRAENRQRFKELLDKIGLKQPPNNTFTCTQEALRLATIMRYPLVLRPSYVLGGRAIALVKNESELQDYLKQNSPNGLPVLMEQFIENALEVEMDVVCDSENILIGGIMEQFEPAGIHSGDSSCCIPTMNLDEQMRDELIRQVSLLVRELNIVGLMNVQFAIQKSEIYVLEVNPRASRTIPFVAKATGTPLVELAIDAILGGKRLREVATKKNDCPALFAVKAPVFPFSRLPNSDTSLGMEMKSTGEVMGIGKCLHEAFAKAKEAIDKNANTKNSDWDLYRLQNIEADV